jgi:hypothetical protein
MQAIKARCRVGQIPSKESDEKERYNEFTHDCLPKNLFHARFSEDSVTVEPPTIAIS